MKSKINLRSLAAWGVALGVSVVLVAAGACLRPLLPGFDAAPLHYILIAALAVLCLVNRLAAGVFVERHFAMPQEERDAFSERHRADCEADPEAALRHLSDMAVLPITLLVLYYLLVGGILLTGGMGALATAILGVLLLGMPLQGHFDMLPNRLHRKLLVPKDKMPRLRALAQRAADATGVRGELQIEIESNTDCAVEQFGRVYVVFFGTRLLAVTTEEELYRMLLYKFELYAHPRAERRLLLYHHLSGLGSAKMRPMTWIFDLYFSFADAHMEWYGDLYKTALSHYFSHAQASRARREGAERAALSALAKHDLWRYFDNEWDRYFRENYYAPASPRQDSQLTVCNTYRRALSERYRVWNGMLEQEIPLQPSMTLHDHRRLLGLEGEPFLAPLTLPDPHSPYGEDCLAAIRYEDDRITAQSSYTADYEESRRRFYLEPLAVVEEWEASDKNRPTSEMSPVINAYRTLARFEEVEALCDKILAEEPNDFAKAHAIYAKGNLLLARYDREGIDYLYRAMDLNQNYMKEGLKKVEAFCALCGLADELETCRRRGAILMDAHAANHEGAATLHHSDRLVAETELGDQLPTILAYMEEVSGGYLEQVYLVRKVIAEDFFSSTFVLYFTPGIPDADLDRAYEAIFHYLDGYPVDWQFSLFLYDRETEMAVKKVPGSLVWEREEE